MSVIKSQINLQSEFFQANQLHMLEQVVILGRFQKFVKMQNEMLKLVVIQIKKSHLIWAMHLLQNM